MRPKSVSKMVMTLAVVASLAIGSKAQAQNRPFEAISLGPVTELNGLSNDTPVKVVGQALRNGIPRAFAFSEGQTSLRFLELVPGDPANTTSTATAISDDGSEAVGVDRSRATDWPVPAGPISNPGHFPAPAGCGDFSKPVSLNDNRQAVGSCWAYDGGGTKPIFYSANGQFVTADLPTGNFQGYAVPQPGRALDINNGGIIVGQVSTINGSRAAIWTNPNQLPILVGLNEARGISSGSVLANNADLVTMAGNYPTPGGAQPRGWTFAMINGAPAMISMTRIPFVTITLPPNYPSYYLYLLQPFIGSETKRINRNGISAGFVKLNNGGTSAAMWNLGGAFADVAAATTGLPVGTVLTEAVDINDQGYVLAKGLVNGQLQGFLLRPTGVAINFASGGTY